MKKKSQTRFFPVGLRRSGAVAVLQYAIFKHSDSGLGRLKEGYSSGYFAGLRGVASPDTGDTPFSVVKTHRWEHPSMP
jgi:hypothetical protein